MTKRTNKKIKATELFLSLGLAASLVTSCGEPAPEGGEAVESDTTETIEEAPEESEGGEGGEGGEG